MRSIKLARNHLVELQEQFTDPEGKWEEEQKVKHALVRLELVQKVASSWRWGPKVHQRSSLQKELPHQEQLGRVVFLRLTLQVPPTRRQRRTFDLFSHEQQNLTPNNRECGLILLVQQKLVGYTVVSIKNLFFLRAVFSTRWRSLALTRLWWQMLPLLIGPLKRQVWVYRLRSNVRSLSVSHLPWICCVHALCVPLPYGSRSSWP